MYFMCHITFKPPNSSLSKEKDRLKPKKKEKKDPSALKEREVPQHPSCLFFQYNTQLGPPYHILVDTNFINFSIKAKLDLVQSMMDCLYAKCIPCITDCVMAEIEKLGQKYRVALRIAKDPRFERLPCTHKGTYADDCLVQRVTQEFGSSSPCLPVAQKYFSVTVKSFRGLSHRYPAISRFLILPFWLPYQAPHELLLLIALTRASLPRILIFW
nr:rRNA-processing protein FCF1 homolog isoform X2 [Manis javanica]